MAGAVVVAILIWRDWHFVTPSEIEGLAWFFVIRCCILSYLCSNRTLDTMKIFFLQFKVTPTKANESFTIVKNVKAFCWVRANNSQSACAKAKFYVSMYNWKIGEIEYLPVEVTEEHFSERDIGLEKYLHAQEEGMAFVCVASAKDGKTSAGPFPLKPSYAFPLSDFLKKQLANKGRCLHYESGHRCKEIIKAHSIQKNRALSIIADKGHVYAHSSNISLLKKNKGQLTFEKKGINSVSTFLGFCSKHDNELFEPIDNYSLIPTNQQVLLYAYRSLCRELFVKENALELIKHQLGINARQNAINKLFLNIKKGTAFGLKNLKIHKKKYDNSLRKNSFSSTRYVLFTSKQKPTIAFSGIFFPDFDFMGRELQDLGNHSSKLELITICSAPMDCGWGFLFAWHATSSNVCVDFMRSLATMIHNKNNTLSDFLFRLVVTNCENTAISPKWWEHLPEDQKEQIKSKASLMADIFSVTTPPYLIKGLEGISRWDFNVISNME